MPTLKESQSFEWHGVKCGVCALNFTEKIKIGALLTSKVFNEEGVYICSDCRRGKSQKSSSSKSQKSSVGKSQNKASRKSQNTKKV